MGCDQYCTQDEVEPFPLWKVGLMHFGLTFGAVVLGNLAFFSAFIWWIRP